MNFVRKYLYEHKLVELRRALSIVKLFEEGRISATSAYPFYVKLGGKKHLDDEGKDQEQEILDKRGATSLSQEELYQIIMQRGLEELWMSGKMKKINEFISQEENPRKISR